MKKKYCAICRIFFSGEMDTHVNHIDSVYNVSETSVETTPPALGVSVEEKINMTEKDLHSFVYWLAMRIVCALFGHVYWQNETLEDGSVIGFECELCARCDTPG